MDLYCVKCCTHTPTVDQTTITTSNNRPALTDKCAKCGTICFRFLKKKAMEVMSLPNWQTSPDSRGQTIQEKNIFQDIVTVGQGLD